MVIKLPIELKMDGYFVCSIGEASPETIHNYIIKLDCEIMSWFISTLLELFV